MNSPPPFTSPNGALVAKLPNNFKIELNNRLKEFWEQTFHNISTSSLASASEQPFPFARVKKVMKMDEEVRKMMIASDAPMLFVKAAEIFIMELTIRAWIHAEESKRRTLQRIDIVSALSQSDMYDFLIDVIPRDELFLKNKESFKSPIDTATYSPRLSESSASSVDGKSFNTSSSHTLQHSPQLRLSPFTPDGHIVGSEANAQSYFDNQFTPTTLPLSSPALPVQYNINEHSKPNNQYVAQRFSYDINKDHNKIGVSSQPEQHQHISNHPEHQHNISPILSVQPQPQPHPHSQQAYSQQPHNPVHSHQLAQHQVYQRQDYQSPVLQHPHEEGKHYQQTNDINPQNGYDPNRQNPQGYNSLFDFFKNPNQNSNLKN